MPNSMELTDKLWSALKDDRTVMIALADTDEAHARPMTAQVEDESGTLWFFSSTESRLVEELADTERRAVITFASKNHSVFATIHGDLEIRNDRAMIDRLWNPFVAAWYEGGKTDPKLMLMRFDPDDAEIWLDDSSFLAGVKMMLGIDPKKDYRDKVAKVTL
jgi:general stress protein 26